MNIGSFLQIVIVKTKLNLHAEARQSYLSYVWWLLEPALFVGLFYIVFGIFLGNGNSSFLIFLLCGQIPFMWFARTVGNCSASIEQGKGLMQQIRIPKLFFPLVTVCQDAIKSICIFILFFLFLMLYSDGLNIHWTALPILMVVQLFFNMSIAIVGAMIVPFIPDFKFLINTFLQMMMFASGVFFNYKEVLLPEHHDLFILNPLANIITQYRSVLIGNTWPDFYALSYIFGVSVLLILSAVIIMKKIDSLYPKVLAE